MPVVRKLIVYVLEYFRYFVVLLWLQYGFRFLENCSKHYLEHNENKKERKFDFRILLLILK